MPAVKLINLVAVTLLALLVSFSCGAPALLAVAPVSSSYPLAASAKSSSSACQGETGVWDSGKYILLMYVVTHRQHRRVEDGFWLLVCGCLSRIRSQTYVGDVHSQWDFSTKPMLCSLEMSCGGVGDLHSECFSSLSFFFFFLNHLSKCRR